MAKGKKQSKRPQAKHKPKSRSSQHDKRKRLETPNPRRKQTVKAKVPRTGKMAVLVTSLWGVIALPLRSLLYVREKSIFMT